MFEKDPKTGMMKPVWEKPRRNRGIADMASTKSSDEIAGSTRPSAPQAGLAFEDAKGWWWSAVDKEVRFTVRKDGRSILIRLPQAWLEARYKCEATDKAFLAAARAEFDPLTDLAAEAVEAGRFEQNGTIVFK
jgi:hypothetical protein